MKIKDIMDREYKCETKYQRKCDAWPLKLKQRLINSILEKYYIPSIIIANGEVVDGKQRITTISDFLENKFKIEFLNKSCTYDQLEKYQQENIKNYKIHVVILNDLYDEQEISDEKIKEIFLRINEGSVKLNKAELLMAKAPENIRKIIKKLTENEKIQKISNNKKKDKRFSIAELIIRVFAIIDMKEKNIQGCARNHREKVINDEKFILDHLKKYDDTLDLMYEILSNSTIKSKSFNTLFESIFVAFYLNYEHFKSFKENKEKIKEKVYDVQKTINSKQMGGGNRYDDMKYVNERIEIVQNALSEFMKSKNRSFTYEDKLDLWNKEKNPICKICFKKLENINSCELDHIIPYSKGGKTEISNCQLLCIECNRKKRDN